MATILEVKGNDINIEVEKLSMSLTKLGCIVPLHNIKTIFLHINDNCINFVS